MKNTMIKNNLKFLLSFGLRVLLFSVAALLLYAIALHFIGGGHLVFYRGIVVILAIFTAFSTVLFFSKNNFYHNFPALCLAVALLYSFHITIPVILDRSISIQVMGTLTKQPMEIKNLNEAFLQGYVDGYSTTCRRLNEQINTGNVVIKDGVVSLTKKGLAMQKIFNFIAEFLKVEDHYIKGNLDSNYIHHYSFKDNQCVNNN